MKFKTIYSKLNEEWPSELVKQDVSDIQKQSEDFLDKIKNLINEKFGIIGKELRTILKPSSKGERKGLLIFVPDAFRKIEQIEDDFVKFVVRDIYDNYADIKNNRMFTMHMNWLFNSDFVFSLVKELNEKVKFMEKKKQELEEYYKNQWSLIYNDGRIFDFFYRKEKDNVFYKENPKSKPFWDKRKEFTDRVMKEHPRVKLEKLFTYIRNDYHYNNEYDKIKKDYLKTIPEYVKHEERISKHMDDENNDLKIIQKEIDEELKQLNWNVIKKTIEDMVNAFVHKTSKAIYSGELI